MSSDGQCLWLFLTVSWVSLQCVIVVFPDHTHLIFLVGQPCIPDIHASHSLRQPSLDESVWLVLEAFRFGTSKMHLSPAVA